MTAPPSPQTPFAALLARLRWSRPRAAAHLRISPSTARYWAAGRNSRGNPCEAPAEAVARLQRVAEAVERG